MPMDQAAVQRRRALPDPATAARVAWLERFYDLVFVAVVGRFANELGATPDLAHTLSVLGWLAWLWVAWFLVSLRLNRFPDEGWLTRAIVVAQLLATTVAAAAAISATTADDRGGVVATIALDLGISALYLTIPRRDAADRRLVAVPVVGSAVIAATELLRLVMPRAAAAALTSAAGLAFVAVVFGWYLPRLARNRPVEPRHAGDRHGQLFLILMGLSFLKVAFATNPKYGVEYPVVIGAFAAGFALWSIYVDGVLPLGFPVRAGPQRGWLIAQLGLALGVTVAAAAVTALPPSRAGTVTVTGAALEGGALAAVMAAFAVLALTAQHPALRLAWARCGAALAIAAVTVAAIVGGKLPDRTFSAALATLVIAAAAADGLLRRRLRAPIQRRTRSWGRSPQAAPAGPVTAARKDG
jgi:low temperature requirement protein LtrA